jgi:hypothetical protein
MQYDVAVIAGQCGQGKLLGTSRRRSKDREAIYKCAASAGLISWQVGLFKDGTLIGRLDPQNGELVRIEAPPAAVIAQEEPEAMLANVG